MTDAVIARYFEELVVGDTYRHSIERTITETDNLLFSTLTCNTEPLHLDARYGESSVYGARVANSTLVLCLVCGVGGCDFSHGGTVGGLGCADVRFTRPVFIGDTIRAESEVVDKRDACARADAGVIELESRAYNQRDELVIKFRNFQLIPRCRSVA